MKKIYVGCDHRGWSLKEHLKQKFTDFDWQDMGTDSEDSVDYPDFATKVCDNVIKDSESLGLLICGSGQGMAIRANKYKNIRAALCWNEDVAALSRQHNNANVLCMGASFADATLAEKVFQQFLTAEFEGGRHQTRVDKLSAATND